MFKKNNLLVLICCIINQINAQEFKPANANTYLGMHSNQSEMFTKEYQTEFIKAYLDVMETKNFVTGAHVWAFADFKTTQGIIRFGEMNWKGVFTRDRKPKMAAFYLKQRWAQK